MIFKKMQLIRSPPILTLYIFIIIAALNKKEHLYE